MSEWEYLSIQLKSQGDGSFIVTGNNQEFNEYLEEMGKQGWELISIVPIFAGFGGNFDLVLHSAWLKRQK